MVFAGLQKSIRFVFKNVPFWTVFCPGWGGTPGSPFEKTFQVGLPPQNPIQRPVGILFGTTNERKKRGFWQHADAESRAFTIILTRKIPKPYVFALILGVSRPPRPHASPPQRQLRAEFTVKTQGFENMEDKLTAKTQGFGISMLPRPRFLQRFHVSKLSTAWRG